MASIIKVDTIQDQDGNNIINENANTITIGKSGDTVQVAAGAEFVGGGTQWQSSIVTGTTLSAVAGNGYWIDTTSNACTVTLPGSASVGDTIEFVDYARTWNTNAITINPNSLNYQGNTSPNPEYNTDGQHVRIVYSGATQGWIPTTDDDVSLETPQTYSADMLIVAGGGGGGGAYYSAGGGAGGFRTSTQDLTIGSTYTVTVGDGGAGGSTIDVRGSNGSDSSISGAGITTITSAGGGGGGSSGGTPASEGLNGGSGGGGSGYNVNTGRGAGNTPATTPSQGNDGGTNTSPSAGGGGGGGGAGAVGQDTTAAGGNGGNGAASSITGSSVTYAGGGGGSDGPGTNSAGTGGTGGGGNGGIDSTPPTAGTANTGGGGGGVDGGPGGSPKAGAAGGKGVVIISVPTADYTGTTTGSPTVSVSGSNTIMQFNGSGSYTA